MSLHFTAEEFTGRVARTCEAMQAAGLDALLCFRQESMYWLTGYDTFGYVFFQCLVLRADGRMALLTRAPDLRQAQLTSTIGDIRIWVDREGGNPVDDLRAVLDDFNLANGRLGVEYEAYGLTARNGRRLDEGLAGYARLEDASSLISRLRVIKSPAEIEYVRRAGELGDDALEAAWPLIRPGAFEGDILAAMQGAVFSGGGDYSGNEFIIGSGSHALLCRYQTGRRHLDADDQLTLEWAGVYHRYHAAMMRTIAIGDVPQRQKDLYRAARDALLAVEEKLVPGNTYGDAFAAHADVMDRAGLQNHRLNACGYSLGTTFAPNWMDWPMLYSGNPVEFEPGMTVFCHMIIADSDAGLAMTLGRTSLITAGQPECLSKAPLDPGFSIEEV
jgi:Xaa-Pro dipeptidase